MTKVELSFLSLLYFRRRNPSVNKAALYRVSSSSYFKSGQNALRQTRKRFYAMVAFGATSWQKKLLVNAKNVGEHLIRARERDKKGN